MTTPQRTRRWALRTGAVMVAAASVLSPSLPERASARVIATTVPFALVAPAIASDPTVSANGQFVVFTSAPGTEDGRTSSIWLSDQSNGELTELTLPNPNVRVGNSVHPVISADGCAVVMTTEIAYDLFRDDDANTRWDVYRAALPSCGGKVNDWTLVSTLINANGVAQARDDVDPNQAATLSSSGSVIAYVRPFLPLSGVTDDTPLPNTIDVVDLTIPIDDAAHTVAAPGLPTEVDGTGVAYVGQSSPVLSGDGGILAFSSDATSSDAVAEWATPAEGATTVPTQIFAWQRDELDPFLAVQQISSTTAGSADASAVTPALSSNGRYVAFSSSASNLVSGSSLTACAGHCPAQVFLVDRDTDGNQIYGELGTTSIEIVSALATTDGTTITAGNGASFAPSMSADGTTLAFASQASNLLEVQTPGGGEAGDGDLIIANLTNGTLQRAFESPAPAPGAHGHPHLSANSRVLVADTLVADRLLGDTTGAGRHVVAASYVPSLSMADLDLGTVMVTIPGPEWFVNVVNGGPGTFLPDTITIDNPDFSISGGTCPDRAPVAAGQSCSVKVILTPSVEGPETATLTVAEAGYGAITLTAELRGAGGVPALAADPTAADTGDVVVGQTSETTASFAIYNVYVGPATVSSVTIGGANPEDFRIVQNGCVGEIPIAGQCPVQVAFTPTAAGRRTATVSAVTSFGQYTSVLVSGTGIYEPKLVAPATAKPGESLSLGGTGFPANTGVIIAWNDGTGRAVLLTTSDDGGFLATFPVSLSRRPGAAVLIAQVPGGPSASSTVTVERLRDRAGVPIGSRR